MALHDYRRMIAIHGGGYIAVEITPDNRIELDLGILDELAGQRSGIVIDKATAGVLLDVIAGAIKTLENLAPGVVPPQTTPGITLTPEEALDARTALRIDAQIIEQGGGAAWLVERKRALAARLENHE